MTLVVSNANRTVGIAVGVLVVVGVLVGGSAVGVFVGGSAVGVLVGGSAVGVLVGGSAVGVLVGGSAVGVLVVVGVSVELGSCVQSIPVIAVPDPIVKEKGPLGWAK